MFVFFAATGRDAVEKTAETYRIVAHAARLREDALPPNLFNAAMVLVAYFHRETRAHKWMKQVA